ncbi:MAG: cell wall hydrolase [Lachnospiraceae bacterium]|nr:cell wall hydrolase [Lachnospiraceae bacterium]
MKTNRKLFAGAGVKATGIVLSLVMFLGSGMTAQAAENGNRISSLSGGVGMLLEPKRMDTAEKITEMAAKLNVSLDTKEEVVSKLVMANVKQELNVRKEASTDSEMVGVLYKDCGGTILERKNGWTKLQSGNIIGWASDEYLLFGEEAEKLADDVGKMIATVNVETLRVRKEANDNAEVYGLIPKGEFVEVIEDEDSGQENLASDGSRKWIRVDYDGKDGYVVADYVDLTFQIDAGETVQELQARLRAEKEAKRHVNYGEYTTDADTKLLLAALIQCEAGGEPYEGQVAVGAVVMNRLRSPAYPDSIHGVIYASGQFTPAMSGKVNRVYESGRIYDSCIKAAEEALSGVSNVGDLTHFRRNNGREGLVIGNHVFY